MGKSHLEDQFLATWRMLARNGWLGHAYPEPEREFHFHPVRRWKFDFAWPAALVAVEVEGGVFREGGGAHSHPTNIIRDIEKYNTAAFMGWIVVRMAEREINGNPVPTCEQIARLITHRRLDQTSEYDVGSYASVPTSVQKRNSNPQPARRGWRPKPFPRTGGPINDDGFPF